MKLMQGDCLERMKEIESGSVDMVLADPPYGTTACKWDSIIPLEPMWEQLKRVIKPNGAIVMTASQPFTTTLIASNMKMFKYCWVWEKSKGVGFLNAKNAPIKFHEDVLVFSEGATANRSKRNMPYFPQGLKADGRTRKQPDVCDSVGTRPCRSGDYVQEFSGYPTTILRHPNDGGKLHPTQKPVALMEYLIKTYTNEGETVLDFTMGSGTTGVACANLNRDFIGIEMDLDYFNIAQTRIEEAIESNARLDRTGTAGEEVGHGR
jgi:site-specific DNA-methyltransferase (adenine-specific)